jgi:murein endopeptidase
MRVVAGAGLAVVLLGLVLSGISGAARTRELLPVPAVGVPALRELSTLPPAGAAPQVHWRRSKAVGAPYAGRLRHGVRLPAEGNTYFTWDPIRDMKPNRGWRRWGTDRLVRTTLRVARRYAAENPGAPRLTIGDLSRPHGGNFGPQYGGLGHVSHQNGLDIDIYYPRADRRERAAREPGQVDVRLSQKLVNMFVAAGAQRVFVGPSLDLHGPRRIVTPLVHHDDHLHVRLPTRSRT